MSFYEIFYQLLKFSMPLLIVALGGMFSERSGVVNIALDGIMIFGAFVSIVFINLVQGMAEPFLTGQWLFIVAMLISAISGMLLSATHAYACCVPRPRTSCLPSSRRYAPYSKPQHQIPHKHSDNAKIRL